jgi:hypothetical protein
MLIMGQRGLLWASSRERHQVSNGKVQSAKSYGQRAGPFFICRAGDWRTKPPSCSGPTKGACDHGQAYRTIYLRAIGNFANECDELKCGGHASDGRRRSSGSVH